MTHEESNRKTKEMLSSSLKKLMQKRAFSKITVSEIIEDCQVNRKTFYYHFEDLYGLLRWTLDREAVEVVKQFDLLVDYEDALRFVVDYVEQNAHILNCAFDGVGREQLKRFFHNDFFDMTMNLILESEKQSGVELSFEFRRVICNFLLEGTEGILIDGITSKDGFDKETAVKNVCTLIRALPDMILALSNAQKAETV